MNRSWKYLAGGALLAAALAAPACGEDGIVLPSGSGGAGGTDSSSGGDVADGGHMSGSGGDLFGGSGSGCLNDDDCNGGVCNNGECCASADLVCSDTCCNDGEVCLFDSCITPGDDCFSAADCPDDHYCEPALGEPGMGGMGGMGGNCTQPLTPGKCVPLPPICTGEPTDPPDCIEPCEFEPAVGQLNAVVKWQWGYDPGPTEFPAAADVWATPSVARMFDANCDGKVDLADPPNVVFVSADSATTCCQCGAGGNKCIQGVLRMLDGTSGQEIWSLQSAGPQSSGFAGTSVALGDVDNDQQTDIVALTAEGWIAVISHDGQTKWLGDSLPPVTGSTSGSFGWGGGVALGDMDNDGWPEIAYANSVYTMAGGQLAHLFTAATGTGGGSNRALSHFVDLDGDGDLELLAGRAAYHHDGSQLWDTGGNDGFTAVADFDMDMLPEVVVVQGGFIRIFEGATGMLELGPTDIPGNGLGGPPTVADFNGDGAPEIGVAMQNFYTMLKPNYGTMTIDALWSTQNHDNSSSVTGSSVFDFEGDGAAEVVYMDECFLWVYDGTTGAVLFSTNSQSFTATEASIVADIDGDGHAEMLVVHNAANPVTWTCSHHTTAGTYPVWSPPAAGGYRGITVLGDSANSWVGTRTLWNQHAYNVTNVCDPRDSACMPGSYYGQIPSAQQKNWQQSWLNNFRQNVQDGGLFDAPDPVVQLEAECTNPVELTVTVRNLGLSGLPENVQVQLYRVAAPDVVVGAVTTTKPLLPGQSEVLGYVVPTGQGGTSDSYYARIFTDPVNPTFNECRPENNQSDTVTPMCVQ